MNRTLFYLGIGMLVDLITLLGGLYLIVKIIEYLIGGNK